MSIKREIACGIVQGMGKFWKCSELQDFTVTLGTTKFGCHRFLLAACSGFFRGLFRSGMIETEFKNVDLEDISSETFESILESIYTGHNVLTNDNVTDIWKTADKLQILFLVDECEHFIIKSLSLENYIEYYHIAKFLSSQPVIKAAWSYILKTFNYFVQTSAFLELSMNEMLNLVQSQKLVVNSEHDIIVAILKWTEFKPTGQQNNLSNMCELRWKRLKTLAINNIRSGSGDNETIANSAPRDTHCQKISSENRQKYLGHLLSNARTCLLSRESLEMLLLNPLVSDNKMASDVVNKALLYKLQIGKRNGQWPTAAIHRNCSDSENVALKIKQIESGGYCFEALSISRNKWLNYDIGELTERDFFTVFTMDNILNYFFLVHVQGRETDGTVRAFRSIEKEWEEIKLSLTLKYAKFFVTVIDDLIYILPSNGKVMCSLDPSSETLLSLPRVPADPLIEDDQPISHVTNYEQKILVFSSVSEKGVDETAVQCYDTARNIWTHLNNLEGPANGMTSFRDDHFVYLLKSSGDLWKIIKSRSDVLEFEYVAKLWSTDWSLNGAITFMNKLYICGVKSETLSNDSQLQQSLPGVFSKIVFIKSSTVENMIFLPITVKKTDLV